MKILRYSVPVDDRDHWLVLPGPIVKVGSKGDPGVVEIWVQDEGSERHVGLRAVATGQPWPPHSTHLGTAVVPGHDLVWHLLGRARA